MKLKFYCFGMLFDAFVIYDPGTENTLEDEGDPEEIDFIDLTYLGDNVMFLLHGDLREQLEEAACAVARTMEKDHA